MAKLTSYIHVVLNHDNEEGAEIAEGLARYPAGERSRIIRAAILAYLRNGEPYEVRKKRPSAEQPRIKPRVRTEPADSPVSQPAPIPDTQARQEKPPEETTALIANDNDLVATRQYVEGFLQ